MEKLVSSEGIFEAGNLSEMRRSLEAGKDVTFSLQVLFLDNTKCGTCYVTLVYTPDKYNPPVRRLQ